MKGWVRKRIRRLARPTASAVRRAQLFDAEQRDDLLQVAIVGDGFADILRNAVMGLADKARVEQARSRGKGVHRRIHAFACHVAGQDDGGIEMAENLGHGRVGKVVRGHIDRLDRSDGGSGHRGDAFLELGDFAGQGGLVADARRQPAEQAGHLAARLDQAVDVVDQEQHVFAGFVAKILRDCQSCQAGPPARSRRFVHLSEDERGARKHAGLLEFEQQFVPLARALADPGENRNAGMPFDSGADQLHDQHGLADARAAEHGRLAAFYERCQQIDDLDAGVKYLKRGSSGRAKAMPHEWAGALCP